MSPWCQQNDNCCDSVARSLVKLLGTGSVPTTNTSGMGKTVFDQVDKIYISFVRGHS